MLAGGLFAIDIVMGLAPRLLQVCRPLCTQRPQQAQLTLCASQACHRVCSAMRQRFPTVAGHLQSNRARVPSDCRVAALAASPATLPPFRAALRPTPLSTSCPRTLERGRRGARRRAAGRGAACFKGWTLLCRAGCTCFRCGRAGGTSTRQTSCPSSLAATPAWTGGAGGMAGCVHGACEDTGCVQVQEAVQ